MVTCATTGVICVMIELTGDKTGAIFAEIGVTSAAIAVTCETTYEMGTTELLATSDATFGETSETCVRITAICATIGVTSGTTVATSVATIEAKFSACPRGRAMQRRPEDSCRRIFLPNSER